MKGVRFYYDNYGRLSEIKAVMPLLFFDARKGVLRIGYEEAEARQPSIHTS